MNNIYKSCFPDVIIPEIPFQDFIFNNFKEKNLKKKAFIEFETERSIK